MADARHSSQSLHPDLPRVFIGYDSTERVAANVLADSIQFHASQPVHIAQVRLSQLSRVFVRPRDPKQSTEFSFSRFLVPWLCGFQGWAIFVDCDLLCLGDISNLWVQKDARFAVQVVKHRHNCIESTKFQGMPQLPYQRKNWSSVMLFNCERCQALSPDYVHHASGLELHQFRWLGDDMIGELSPEWNVLVGVQPLPERPMMLHFTLGGPWFSDCQAIPESHRWLAAWTAMNLPLQSMHPAAP
jgi:lipopolysaccharide biosynthesis glycosyltransferase